MYKKSFKYNPKAEKGAIRYIDRRYKDGMAEDTYTVHYENGYERRYTIKFKMLHKHFDFIMNASRIKTKYFEHNGRITKSERYYA